MIGNVFREFDRLMNVEMVFELYRQLLRFVVDLKYHFDFDRLDLILVLICRNQSCRSDRNFSDFVLIKHVFVVHQDRIDLRLLVEFVLFEVFVDYFDLVVVVVVVDF